MRHPDLGDAVRRFYSWPNHPITFCKCFSSDLLRLLILPMRMRFPVPVALCQYSTVYFTFIIVLYI